MSLVGITQTHPNTIISDISTYFHIKHQNDIILVLNIHIHLLNIHTTNPDTQIALYPHHSLYSMVQIQTNENMSPDWEPPTVISKLCCNLQLWIDSVRSVIQYADADCRYTDGAEYIRITDESPMLLYPNTS